MQPIKSVTAQKRIASSLINIQPSAAGDQNVQILTGKVDAPAMKVPSKMGVAFNVILTMPKVTVTVLLIFMILVTLTPDVVMVFVPLFAKVNEFRFSDPDPLMV